MKEEKYYEKTDYPELYKHYYWGNFKYHNEDGDNIIKARNNFASYFQPEYVDNIPQYILDIIDRNKHPAYDHCEVYKTKYSYIILNSPYNHVDKKAFRGWDEQEPHYSNQAYTFIKIVPKKIKPTKGERLLIDYSLSKDVLYTKSLLCNNINVLNDINLNDNILLFDGKNPHDERVIDFMANRDESYKFIGFSNSLTSNQYELIYHTVDRYNTFYKQNIDINEILEYFKHN